MLDFCTTHDRKRLDRAVEIWLGTLNKGAADPQRGSQTMKLTRPPPLFSFSALALRGTPSSLPCSVWPQLAPSQLTPGSMDIHWNEGSFRLREKSSAPLASASLQSPNVHPSRKSLLHLRSALHVSPDRIKKALLIDTGDVADPNQMPLAKDRHEPVTWRTFSEASFARRPHASARRPSRRQPTVRRSSRNQ